VGYDVGGGDENDDGENEAINLASCLVTTDRLTWWVTNAFVLVSRSFLMLFKPAGGGNVKARKPGKPHPQLLHTYKIYKV
jgi:hypothetical protein